MVGGTCPLHGLHAGTRCPACAKGRADRSTEQKRALGSTRIRSTARWKKVAERVKQRDGRRCTFGLYDEDDTRGVPPGGCRARHGLDVHHRVPLEDDGEPYDEDNLRTLCDNHHATVEAAYRQSKETDDGEAPEF